MLFTFSELKSTIKRIIIIIFADFIFLCNTLFIKSLFEQSHICITRVTEKP